MRTLRRTNGQLLTSYSYFAHNSPSGLIKPGTDPVDGIYNDEEERDNHRGIGAGDLPDSEVALEKLIESHATPEYLSFLQSPELRSYVRDIMEWKDETLLTRTMLRHNLPGGVSTGVHYDKLFLRGGDAFFLTAWVPIGQLHLIVIYYRLSSKLT